MEISQPVYLANPTREQLTLALRDFSDEQTLIVLVAEGGDPDLQTINEVLSISGSRYAGALFPKVLFADQVHDEGLVIIPLPGDSAPITISGLESGQFNLQDLPPAAELQNHSLLILVDGLSRHIADFLRRLYGHFGANVVYLGGGAGSLSLRQSPCIFSNSGLAQDHAIIVPMAIQLKLGVQHGWKRLMGPLIATEVDNNTIKQINWQNAYSVYRDVVERESGRRFTRNNFFDIAKGFPFGLEKNDAEDIVRDPIMVTGDGSLVCVGEVPENAIIYILKGDSDDLTQSARAAADASTRQNEGSLKLAFIIDCISRILFLEENFAEELDQINQSFNHHGSEIPAVGALTLGEISSVGDGLLEFLNKTVVIGTLD